MNEEALPTSPAVESDGSVSAATIGLGQTALVPAANADILKAFDGPRAEIAKWAATAATIKITDASQTREMRMAKESRLALVKVRTRAETVKKGLKEGILARGKAIDSAYNELVGLIKPIEATLLEQETYGEKLEAERLLKVRAEREAVLHQLYVHPVAFPAAIDTMTDAEWATVVSGHTAALEGKRAAEKAAEEARVAREKAEAEARVLKEKADAEERERQRVETLRLEEERRVQAEENARLRAEAEARETQMLAERQAAEEAARVERERVEAVIRAVEEEARIDRERIEAARVAAEAVANEERAKAEAERAAERVKVEAELARFEEERQAERDKAMAHALSLAAEARSLRDAEAARAAVEAKSKGPTRAKYAAMVAALTEIAAANDPFCARIARTALDAVGET